MTFHISGSPVDTSVLDSPLPHEQADSRLLVGMLILLGLLLRIWGLHAQSFTMDEMTELGIAKLGAWGAIRAGDGFPPLYNLLLQGWLELSGGAEAARWLSVGLGVLTIPIMFEFARLSTDRNVGLVSAFLLAISPIHIWYSQEVRAYPLYVLLALATLWRYGVARRTDQPRDWALYTTAAVAGLYTHYYFGFILVAIVAIDIGRVLRQGQWRRAAAAHLAIGALAVPMLLMLRTDLRVQMNWPDQGRPLDLSALGYTLVTFFGGYSLGPSLRELHIMSARAAVREVLPWAVAGGLAVSFLFWRGLVSQRRSQFLRIALLIAIPVMLCGVLGTLVHVGYRVRYIVWCVAPFLILLAIGSMSPGLRRSRFLALLVLCVLSAAALSHRRYEGRYANEDARAAAEFVEQRIDHTAPVFVIAGYMAGPIDYYLGKPGRLHPLTRAEAASAATALAVIHGSAPAGHAFWLLYSRAFEGDMGAALRDQLHSVAGLQLRHEVPGFEIYEGTGW